MPAMARRPSARGAGAAAVATLTVRSAFLLQRKCARAAVLRWPAMARRPSVSTAGAAAAARHTARSLSSLAVPSACGQTLQPTCRRPAVGRPEPTATAPRGLGISRRDQPSRRTRHCEARAPRGCNASVRHSREHVQIKGAGAAAPTAASGASSRPSWPWCAWDSRLPREFS